MHYEMIGIDLANGPDKTAYIKIDKNTGKIVSVETTKQAEKQ